MEAPHETEENNHCLLVFAFVYYLHVSARIQSTMSDNNQKYVNACATNSVFHAPQPASRCLVCLAVVFNPLSGWFFIACSISWSLLFYTICVGKLYPRRRCARRGGYSPSGGEQALTGDEQRMVWVVFYYPDRADPNSAEKMLGKMLATFFALVSILPVRLFLPVNTRTEKAGDASARAWPTEHWMINCQLLFDGCARSANANRGV